MKYPNIEAERARNGMSSENLAAALGVSRKTLYNWCATGNIPQSALTLLHFFKPKVIERPDPGSRANSFQRFNNGFC